MKRIFVVGCPRSGTTLVQSALAGSPALLSLSETHILRLGIGPTGAARLNPTRRSTLLNSLKEDLNIRRSAQPDFHGYQSRKELITGMVSILDTAAAQAALSGWIEKTPEHLFYASQIETHFPETRFIHVVRDGGSTVTSVVDMWEMYTADWSRIRLLSKHLNDYRLALAASHKKPTDAGYLQLWRMKAFARACTLWNDCILATKACLGRANHLAVSYERFTADPAVELQRICKFLEIDFNPEMLNPEANISKLVKPNEKWKQENANPIRPASTSKYDALEKSERAFISQLLLNHGDSQCCLQ